MTEEMYKKCEGCIKNINYRLCRSSPTLAPKCLQGPPIEDFDVMAQQNILIFIISYVIIFFVPLADTISAELLPESLQLGAS